MHPFVDSWRKERFKMNPVQLLQFYSSLVAEMRMVTSYTEIFGCRIPKMVGCFQKLKVEVYLLLSQETSHRRFMCSIRCGKTVGRFGICWPRGLPSTLQVHLQKCLPMYCWPLRISYPRKVGFQGNLLWGGLGLWKRLAGTMLKLGLDPCFNSSCYGKTKQQFCSLSVVDWI